jgi:predicted transcriptional regulator
MKQIVIPPTLKNILIVVERSHQVVIAKGLSKYREKHGIKANFLAKELGISTSFLCSIEKGRRPVPSHLIEKIQSILIR